MFRPYLIHNCFNPTHDYQVWSTQQRPHNCPCKYRVDREERDELLEEGVIQPVIVGWNTLGEKPTPTYSESVYCFTKRAAMTPRVATVEAAHIKNAYVENMKWAQERIDEWGRLKDDVILSLMVPWRDDPFVGRSLILHISDERTSVGVDVPEVPSAPSEE